MSNEQNWNAIRDVTTSCTVALFEAYGVDLRPCAGCTVNDEANVIAAIGFAGDELRGALAISMSMDVVRASNTIAESPTPDQSRDWTGELANQILGRVKNRLLRFGAHVGMGTPLVFSGTRFIVHSSKQAPNLRIAFTSEHGPVEVWIDAVFAPDTLLVESADDGGTAEEEGTLLFF